jgi:hypothetical protein
MNESVMAVFEHDASLFAGGDFTVAGGKPSHHIACWSIPPHGTNVAELGVSGSTLRFERNYPNPFRPRTTFRYSLPDASPVRLDIFDVQGRLVTTLVREFRGAGPHSITWDGRNATGALLAGGVYFARLQSAVEVRTRKILLLR